MAEQPEESSTPRETLMEKFMEKLHGEDSSDPKGEKSQPSENPTPAPTPTPTPVAAPAAVPSPSEPKMSKIYRLFGREKPVHQVLGGGKPANVLLWRDKKISAGVLGGVTAIWVLIELLEYHLLTLICHGLILSLAMSFLWSNASTFINKTPPKIPEVSIPEDVVVNVALALRNDINRAFAVLREIASGRDLPKFLAVIAGLWVLSIIGSSCNFLTLFYIVFVMLHTVPLLYEKYEDKVDSYGEKAMVEIKKQYAVFNARVLGKIPRGPFKDKKH